MFQCGEFKFPDVTSPLNKILSRPPRNRVCFSNSDAAGTDYVGYGGGGGCATATGGYNVANNGLNGLTSSLRPQSGSVNGENSNLLKARTILGYWVTYHQFRLKNLSSFGQFLLDVA